MSVISGPRALESMEELEIEEFESPREANWKMMASAAAGSLLGMPLVSSGTFRAAWLEVSQRIAALRK